MQAHWRRLERTARLRCRGPTRDREDLFQDALLRLCLHVDGLRAEEISGFLAWFGRIVDRCVLQAAEAQRERVRPRRCRGIPWKLLAPLPFDPPAPGPTDDPIRPRLPRAAEPHRSRSEQSISRNLALLLRDGLGVRNEIVALVLGRSPDATRMLRRRAVHTRKS